MKNLAAIILTGSLAVSAFHPAVVARADDDERREIQDGRRYLRRDLQQDQRQLEELRRRRQAEIREHDYAEAHRYDQQIQQLENNMHRERRELRNRDRADYRGEHHDRD